MSRCVRVKRRGGFPHPTWASLAGCKVIEVKESIHVSLKSAMAFLKVLLLVEVGWSIPANIWEMAAMIAWPMFGYW